MSFRMNIAHVVSATGWGGMEARTLETAVWQAEHGHEVLVVAAQGGATHEEAARRGLDAFALDFQAPEKLANLAALRKRLRRHGASVADFHTNRSFAIGVQDICPLVRSRHNLNRRRASPGLPKIFPFDQIIATSEAERSHLVSSGASRRKVTVVGEWAEERFFAPPPTAEEIAVRRAALGVRPGDFLIGACGLLRPDNDFAALILATAELRERGLPVSCLVIGGPPETARQDAAQGLHRLAASLGIANSVHLLGYRSDVPALLDVLDVAAVVSRHTAQTRVGPEAAARGLPVVGFAVGALGETVRQGETGFLVGLDDIPAFANALERLLRDPPLRARMSWAAARCAEMNFRQRAKMEQTLAAYRLADARRGLPLSALGVHPQSIVQFG